MTSRRYDVCAAVVSDLPFDARVWKEARSLADAGMSVSLLGCAYDRDRTERRSDHGVDVMEIPFGWRERRKSALRRATVLLRLWAAILGTNARVYHAHNIHVVPPAWLAARARRARLLYDAHELYGEPEFPGLRYRVVARFGAMLERFALHAADAAITTNPSRAKVLSERHGRRDITVLQNVPLLRENVEPLDPGYPKGHQVLLYQGWISAQGRAFRETVKALRELHDVHFVLLGFGWERARNRIRGWAAEEGVADRVHFLPPRSFEELVATAAAATVGLVPIRADDVNTYLADTNKLFEYLMGGLPVAASDLPEIRRVVTASDPPVGELFDPSSPPSIADAVRRLLEDPRLYERRREEARRLARSRFNWSLEERTLLALYHHLVGCGRLPESIEGHK
jgi:glycosyltransferase involved in cell wall biosynthesis